MLMLAESPNRDYFAQGTPREPHMSPSCRTRHYTPPHLVSASPDPSSYDSPMLTPSPLRQRPLFTPFNSCTNDIYLQSPFKSPAQPLHPLKPTPIIPDDEEGSIFLSFPSKGNPPPLFQSTCQPLRTPIKQRHRVSAHPPRPPTRLSSPTFHDQTDSQVDVHAPRSCASLGTKRKSTTHIVSTPVNFCSDSSLAASSTPLSTASRRKSSQFSCQVPLPSSKFVAATPQTKAETDAYLRKQTSTLTRLSIHSPDQDMDSDSGCEMSNDNQCRPKALFYSVQPKRSHPALKTWPGHDSLGARAKGRENEEVAESISPGGRIIKRRARNRPLSSELLGGVRRSLSPSKRISGITFPVADHSRKRSSSSSSESGSTAPRRRASDLHRNPSRLVLPHTRSSTKTTEGSSLLSGSSNAFESRSLVTPCHLNSSLYSKSPGISLQPSNSPANALHNYAGPILTNPNSQAWNTLQSKAIHSSPDSSPPSFIQPHERHIDEEEDLFFGTLRQDFSAPGVAGNTAWPRTKPIDSGLLPRKYRPRDSGVVIMSDDDDDGMRFTGVHVPLAFTSGSLQLPEADGRINQNSVDRMLTNPSIGERLDADNFIVRTLAAASNRPCRTDKKVPGTPVKKLKTQYLAGGIRPWQSAVAEKVGLHFDKNSKKGKVPRKSLPAAFPALGKNTARLATDEGTDSEEDKDSPARSRDKYFGLGIGRPSGTSPQEQLKVRSYWLMRRSSSGAFSSGSESMSSSGTPTRVKNKDWHPTTPLVSVSSANVYNSPSGRSTSGSSNGSTMTFNSPSLPRQPGKSTLSSTRYIQPTHQFSFEEPNRRFEHDFFVDDELGSGEFGKVIKVRCKGASDQEVYAVKKSKRFEGPRHRLRLREEEEILRHLSSMASRAGYERSRHPNVLTFIDSWEEEETLYIQTELCDFGNFAHFLWEFGRAFPRLDEGRVWKIIVDMSNGLRFIHDAGIIHLDLKPSNIFITVNGNFKIGDFGMASLWPRPNRLNMISGGGGGGFEREGDKLYLAPEVLQGRYGKEADMFSFGMTILETASNIVVPDQGEAWHRLRREDFSQVDLDVSPELSKIIKEMMRTEPSLRLDVRAVCDHPVVDRARQIMKSTYLAAKRSGTALFAASPLGSVYEGFLQEILGHREV